MLFAKINPTAKSITQIDPFTTSILDSDYMTVLVQPYGAGATSIRCEAVFGTTTTVDGVISFYKSFSAFATLTSEELAGWGKDDSVLLESVATKLDTTASDFVTITNGSILI